MYSTGIGVASLLSGKINRPGHGSDARNETASPKSFTIRLSHPQFAKPLISDLPLQDRSECASDMFEIIRSVTFEAGVALQKLPSDYCMQQWQQDYPVLLSNARGPRVELFGQFRYAPIRKSWQVFFSLRPTCKPESPSPESENHKWSVRFHKPLKVCNVFCDYVLVLPILRRFDGITDKELPIVDSCLLEPK